MTSQPPLVPPNLATRESAQPSAANTECVTEVDTEYLYHGGFRFALLRLKNEGNRPITLGPQSLSNFEAALRAIDPTNVDAVALTSSGSVFCAGADLKKMTESRVLEEAKDVARKGLTALGRLEELRIPTFAFINGAALGGGLELALHAQYRTASSTARAIGFPEVRLGLVPGWGGIPRTVRLLGPVVAARLVVTDSLAGKNLSVQAAAAMGLIDAVFPPNGFLTASLDYAAGILSASDSPSTAAGISQKPELSEEPWSPNLAEIRKKLDSRFHGAAPAPYRALELIAAAAAFPESSEPAAEIHAFGELLLSDEARASIYAFQLVQSLSKEPAGRPETGPRPVDSVGVIGAGLMASQLALVFAFHLRVPIRITDLSQERLDAAQKWIQGQVEKLLNRGRLNSTDAATICALVSGSTDKSILSDCDVVIEAVFEELDVKRGVLAEVEPLIRPDALLLTNTSSLSVEAMGNALKHPERLVGFHFFNPVAVLPLVEIIRAPSTDETTLATAFELAKRLRKTAVLVENTAGFVVNRILTRLFSEVLDLLDHGADPECVNYALDPLGLPMTPLQLLQFIGPAVQLHICEMMHQTYPERFLLSSSLKALVAARLPGYLTEEGTISPEAAAMLPASQTTDPEAVRSRILIGLAEEVSAMLGEGVVAGPEQVDLCMILGANYPFHTGGLTPLLDREVGTAFHPGLRTGLSAVPQLIGTQA